MCLISTSVRGDRATARSFGSRKIQNVLLAQDMRRHLADFLGWDAVDLRDFADCPSQTQTVLVCHHGGLVFAVLLEHPRQNTVALVPRKIDIDVRWVFPARIEKSFEEEIVFIGSTWVMRRQ